MSAAGSHMDGIDALAAAVGSEHVLSDPEAIGRFLKDNSWLSPLLSHYISTMMSSAGKDMQVQAVVSPADVDELRACLSAAYRHDLPVVVRGGGTSNFGQTTPLEGGIILDMRRIATVLGVQDNRVVAQAGALQGAVEDAARRVGKELTVLTTTYATATCGGWVSGGHVGLGTGLYGTIWDGNVTTARVLSMEDEPRERYLEGDELYPVLHTYGTTGVLTEVSFPVVAANEWLDAVAAFPTFEQAAWFVTALSEDRSILNRVAAAQEDPIPRSFNAIRLLYDEGDAVTLLIVERGSEAAVEALAAEHGGRYARWREPGERKAPVAYMVYGHRMLWLKKLAPQAAFLHCYFVPGREHEQVRAVKERFGDEVWLELKYMRSPWLQRLFGLEGPGDLPATVFSVVDGTKERVREVMAFCDEIGVRYQNPHTFSLEEAGIFPDIAPIVAFKQEMDPKGLLNPGKLGASYFSDASAP